MEQHVHQVKEVVLLPLMYPGIMGELNLTPPRGMLFHGTFLTYYYFQNHFYFTKNNIIDICIL